MDGTYYMAMNPSDNGWLDTMHCRSVEDIKQEIDSANERTVKQGYKAREYVIVEITHVSWNDDRGRFIKSLEEKRAIEEYPKDK